MPTAVETKDDLPTPKFHFRALDLGQSHAYGTLDYDSALRVSGRPAVDIRSHFCVTLSGLGGVGVEVVHQTIGIDVTRRAESIGDGPSS